MREEWLLVLQVRPYGGRTALLAHGVTTVKTHPPLWLVRWTAERDTTEEIIIHARQSPDSALEMDRWFRRKGYLQCGFHYCVSRSGVTETRDPSSIGAHLGGHDHRSVGVCILGWDGKHPDTLDPATLGHLWDLAAHLRSTYPSAEITAAPDFVDSTGGYDPLIELTQDIANGISG